MRVIIRPATSETAEWSALAGVCPGGSDFSASGGFLHYGSEKLFSASPRVGDLREMCSGWAEDAPGRPADKPVVGPLTRWVDPEECAARTFKL